MKNSARRQIVLPVDGRDDLLSSGVRGGKGSSLAVMQRLGLNVPPAMTISTTLMRGYLQTGVFPKRFEGQLKRELAQIEQKAGKTFGGCNNPLLVSVRSGAATSMPGMMDTILNLGFTTEVLAGFHDRGDATFGQELYSRFVDGWSEILESPIPEDPFEQLMTAILAIMNSWDNPRARTYRKHHGISHTLGTAVNVQAMVYGNRDSNSGTGVVFSHNVNTGELGLYGEFLPCAQGEEVVSGKRTPFSIEYLKLWNQPLYEELERAVALLESHEQSMVEVEFTIESGTLFFLQHRRAKATLEARITSLVHDIWKKRITHREALTRITPDEMTQILTGKCFDSVSFEKVISENGVLIEGIPASPGVATGRIVYTSKEAQELTSQGERVILVRYDTDPNDLPGMLVADGIITHNGGATSHAAVVARALGKPAIVGAIKKNAFSEQDIISFDGSRGIAVSGEVFMCESTHKKEVSLYTKWWKGEEFPKPRFNPDWATKSTSVGDCAINVYLLELMAHEARGTVLAHEVLELRRKYFVEVAEIFLCYLVHAVARELRHVHLLDGSIVVASEGERNLVSASGVTPDRIAEREKFTFVFNEIEDPRQLLETAVSIFRGCRWDPAFGGERWAIIAETALWFVEGKLNHTVFIDRVFDLQHNTGSVFNKHVMVTDRFGIERILDIKKRTAGIADFFLYVNNFTREYPGGNSVTSVIRRMFQEGSLRGIWRK